MKGCIENDLKEQIFVIFSVKHIGFCNSSIEVLILPRAIQTNFAAELFYFPVSLKAGR